MIDHPENLAQLWQRASDAYQTASYDSSVYVDSLATEIHVWPCELLGHRPTCIVAVAGSVTLADWIVNAVATTDDTGYHLGYRFGVDTAGPNLLDALRDHVPEGRRVIVVGHSRGGGQAYELARYVVGACCPVAGIVTFGAPGVYTRAVARRHPFAAVTLNVVNRWDPVPRLAVHLHRPGTDITGPSWGHRIHRYRPKPTTET